MKGNTLIFIALALLSLSNISCYQSQSTQISNRLTSFVDPDIVDLSPEAYKISNPSGNILRDAIRVLEKDSRTKGAFDSLTLLERSIGTNTESFRFLGRTTEISKITNSPLNRVITIHIEEQQDGQYYELSLGANP